MKKRATSRRRWRIGELADATGLTVRTLEALAHLRRFDPPKNLAGWSPALMRYLNRSLASLQKEKQEP